VTGKTSTEHDGRY